MPKSIGLPAENVEVTLVEGQGTVVPAKFEGDNNDGKKLALEHQVIDPHIVPVLWRKVEVEVRAGVGVKVGWVGLGVGTSRVERVERLKLPRKFIEDLVERLKAPWRTKRIK